MDQLILNLSFGLGLQGTIGWFLPIFLGTVNVLPSLLVLFKYADKSAEFNKAKVFKQDHTLYDFIVVGGGTAGSVVANRLSETYRVLLIERGGEPNPLTAVPGLESVLINRPETDYAYLTVPQNVSCLSMNNRQSLWSRGTNLGGSSNINSMVYLRGHPYDYDIWAHWTQDQRWSYESLVPYFLRSEQYCFSCEEGRKNNPTNPNFHGKDGELHLTKVSMGNLVEEFLDAMDWAGVPRADLNAPFTRGSDAVVYTQKFGRRMSCRDAFINPVRKRENLKIVKFARVYKVLFDGVQAYGVEYEQFGKIIHAGVTKEVILSAGAIDSPKLLMLSGIGPKEHLKELDIPLVFDSPSVGSNLQDHTGTILGPFLVNQPVSYLPGRNVNLGAAEEFLANGTGPLSLSFAHAVTIFPSSKAEFPDFPDIQIGLSANGISPEFASVLSRIYNMNSDTLQEFYSSILQGRDGMDSFNLIVNYGRPRSRGALRLKSKDFKDDPIINPNYYGVEQDLEVLVEGLKKALEIAENAPSFKNIKAQLSPVPWPKCKDKHIVHRSDEYFRCLAREMTLTLYHFVGTVRMGGEKGEKAGALDSELKVRGVKGLRVIDSSVMPFITTMNTLAPTILIGERGAGFVIDYWRAQPGPSLKGNGLSLNLNLLG